MEGKTRVGAFEQRTIFIATQEGEKIRNNLEEKVNEKATADCH